MIVYGNVSRQEPLERCVETLNLVLEQAKPSIQQLLANESKQERFRALVERLKKDAKFEVNDPALAAMVVDPKAPAVQSAGPAPGFIPAPPPTK